MDLEELKNTQTFPQLICTHALTCMHTHINTLIVSQATRIEGGGGREEGKGAAGGTTP